MKRTSINRVLLSLVCLALLMLTGCNQEGPSFTFPKDYHDVELSLEQQKLTDVPLRGMSDAAIYEQVIYVLNKNRCTIDCFTTDFELTHSLCRMGSKDGELLEPERLFVDQDGIHVLDWGNQRIVRLSHDGTFEQSFAIPAAFSEALYFGGFCKYQDMYLVSAAMGSFESKLLVLHGNGEYEMLQAEAMGDFFFQNGELRLMTQMGLMKDGGIKTLSGAVSGQVYGFDGKTLIKLGTAYQGSYPTRPVPFQDYFAAVSCSMNDVSLFSQDDYKLAGRLLSLSSIAPIDMANPSEVQDIVLLADGDTLYLLWPARDLAVIIKEVGT